MLALLVPLALADTGANEPPVADAGLGLLAYVGDTVALNGTASYDPEGVELGYTWRQAGGPEVGIKSGDTPEPSVTVEAPGTYRFELTVNDGYADSAPDMVEIVVAQTSFGGEAGGGCNSGPVAARAWLLAFPFLLRRRRAA
ncbi:MAG: PKD domain-containing protein [Deltaproteobacteria bacterium]|nr:PKD domain-containing protein [Deltaproteobacteria bacterium]